MNNSFGPQLATRKITDHGSVLTLTVLGGLHYMKGNRKPYFSLTYEEYCGRVLQSCGAGHDRILKYYPQFADLARLHLSDIDGVPSHAEANGWYNLAGALPDHAGEQYHAGNSERHFPKVEIDPAKPWDTTDYRKPTAEESLQLFADYVRVDIDTARYVRTHVIAEAFKDGASDKLPEYEWPDGRAWFAQWIDQQRPRWKAEADACIARHGLVVYGDKWESAAGD